MKKPLHTIPGTIAYVLNQHKDELFDLLSKDKVNETREKVLMLIQDKSIKDKQAVIDATKAFSKTNKNLFLSILTAYMTGVAVS